MLPDKNEQPRILIVDDEPQVANALADVLEDRYRVVIETSPQAALAALESDKAISVIISDQRMPGMTGDQLFLRAREISNATRVLITAYADVNAVIDAVNQGKIFAYLTKPWQSDDIAMTVKRAAEHCELNRTRDVTESKRLDEMKDQFIATVRHELRTPLTAIHASLGLLRGGVLTQNAGQAARLVEIGHDNCAKLLALIGDLLDTVNLEKGEMSYDRAPVDLAETIKAAIAEAREKAADTGVDLVVDAGMPQIAVSADRARLLQVMAKLIDNAVNVTPAQGEIRIRARETEAGTVRISVIDQGPGVAGDLAPNLFRRFSQGDSSSTREKGGVGLGLFIARSIVEAHGGSIGFANNADRGAEFFFELPASHDAARPRLAAAQG